MNDLATVLLELTGKYVILFNKILLDETSNDVLTFTSREYSSTGRKLFLSSGTYDIILFFKF